MTISRKFARELVGEVASVKEKLLTFPEQIKEKKEEVRELASATTEIEQELKLIEADLMAGVQEMINPKTGKAAYSNKEARESELTKRKLMDDDYLGAADDMKKAGYKLEVAKDELDAMRDDLSTTRMLARLNIAELNLWASVDDSEEDSSIEINRRASAPGPKSSIF